VLIRNRIGQFFVLLVENGREQAFHAYQASEQFDIVCWLDKEDDLERLSSLIGKGR
jgi:hypothetical protein